MPNSTLMPVAERIAEQSRPGMLTGDTLTLGLLSGLTGVNGPLNNFAVPCVQLEGVSTGGSKGASKAIFPKPSAGGENLYFADIYWSSLAAAAYEKAGDNLPHWTECLINRLNRKHQSLNQGDTWWVLDMLSLLRETMVFSNKILSVRAKELNDLVFGKYLGDVQMYAEYSHLRGAAVRHFHDSMAAIHAYLLKRHSEVEFTFIAHSLGTVLTFDALLLAHGNSLVFPANPGGSPMQPQNPGIADTDLPFPGYLNGALPDHSWIDATRAFVTLGSPLDKFITLWWYNYPYLNSSAWMRRRRNDLPIKHYNFCDEQDPVGSYLDFVRTTPAYEFAFGPTTAQNKWNDVVYNHTPLFGWAHVSYWRDTRLFKLIYEKIIEGPAPVDLVPEDLEKFEVYQRGVYSKIIFLHYYLVQILCIGLCSGFLIWALTAESPLAIAMATAGFMVSLWFCRKILLLNLGWRQMLKLGEGAAPSSNRELHSALARWSWRLLAFATWLGSFLLLPGIAASVQGPLQVSPLRLPIMGFTAVACVGLYWVLYRLRKEK